MIIIPESIVAKSAKKVKSAKRLSALSGQRLSQFLYHEAIGVFLLPPGWDASPLQGYPQQ